MRPAISFTAAFATLLAGCSTSIDAGERNSPRTSASFAPMSDAMPVVMTFSAETPSGADPMELAANIAREPGVARITLDAEKGNTLSVALVFDDKAALADWREDRSRRFMRMLGEDGTVTSVNIADRGLLARAGLEAVAPLPENLRIVYENEGETADGDADIDAVTTICTGGAICKPSN
jgi:hypothetical protein